MASYRGYGRFSGRCCVGTNRHSIRSVGKARHFPNYKYIPVWHNQRTTGCVGRTSYLYGERAKNTEKAFCNPKSPSISSAPPVGNYDSNNCCGGFFFNTRKFTSTIRKKIVPATRKTVCRVGFSTENMLSPPKSSVTNQ